jgi:hypothetical protein
MRAEYPPLTVAHLTLDAVDSVDHNLELVQQIVAERE